MTNSPNKDCLKETWRSLYKNHPLRIDVLGNREDIQEMSVEDLQKFDSNTFVNALFDVAESE